MKVFNVIVGILLILAGIYCFMNMQAAFLSLAFIIGLVLIAYGIMQAATWISGRRGNRVSGWIFGEGLLTILIGILMVFNPFSSELILSILFGAWLVASGLMRVIASIQTKRNIPGAPWAFMLIVGIVSILVGVYALFNPLVAGVAIAVLLGIFFILQGINSIVYGVSIPGMKTQEQH